MLKSHVDTNLYNDEAYKNFNNTTLYTKLLTVIYTPTENNRFYLDVIHNTNIC